MTGGLGTGFSKMSMDGPTCVLDRILLSTRPYSWENGLV